MYGDALKIERLVGILIDNALKYADAKTEIQFCLTESNHRILLTCSNLCSDLTLEQMEHLFDRFYRAEESHSHQKEALDWGCPLHRLSPSSTRVKSPHLYRKTESRLL